MPSTPRRAPRERSRGGSSFFVDTSSHALIYHFDLVVPITALAFDGSALLVGHADGTIERTDRTGTVLHTYTTSVRSLSALTWLKGSLWVAADAVSTTFPPPFASDVYQLPMP